jgi:type I restriction-modification system DNA methylase subunit
MNTTQSSLLNYSEIKQHYTELAKGMQKAIQLSRNSSEEKLKTNTIIEFEKFFKKFGISLNEILEYEETSLGGIKLNGRSDVISGQLIIEFKIFDWLNKPNNAKKATKQVLEKYLFPIDKRIAKHFNAVIFDGNTTIFVSYDEIKDKWKLTKKPFNDFSLYDWVLLLSKTLKIPVSSKKLSESFSIQNEIAITLVSELYSTLIRELPKNQRVKMLFDEWDKSFSYIYGGILNETNIKNDFKEIAKEITKSSEIHIEVDKFLFCFYTYYALIVKLYASEIASTYLEIKPDSPINALIRTENLKGGLDYIESGNFYKDFADIDNYIEGGFFSWYINSWNSNLEEIIKKVLHELNKFDFQEAVLDEFNSRDIIKNLYQDIIPKKIRHDLGEYYTPDWLIQSVINDVGFDGNPDKKVLDAGCGSGGFLIEAINRVKQKATTTNKAELLSKIMNNIVGFDVNPVAVLTARTNYLLAISPLLKDKPRQIQLTIPIYLADAIITPTQEGQAKLTSDAYLISTVEGLFSLPKIFVESGYLNDGMKIIEDCLESNYPLDDFNKLFIEKVNLSKQDMMIINNFYTKIQELHLQDKNRIWVKIIQNSFAPLLHTDFDFVVGNPPWVKWEFLSKEYKTKLNSLYLEIYKIFSHKGMKASMGYAHDDISVMFMYVAIDKYLKKGGKLGFVMKQTLYKSVAGSEFRKFTIEKKDASIPLKVLKVEDMLELKPFRSSAQAETSTITLEKGKETVYPVPYNVWKPIGVFPNETTPLDEVLKNVVIENKIAYPDNPKDKTDVWFVINKGIIRKKFKQNENYYQSRHGLVNDLNGVYFVNILKKEAENLLIINGTNRAKKKIKEVKNIIEPTYVFPFLKPKNVKKWKIKGYSYALLPQKKYGEKNESELRIKAPLTYKYFYQFKDDLLGRSSKWLKQEGFPFYSTFGIGDYSFKPYKVVWCCMTYSPNFAVVSSVNDSFVGEKQVMPDNTIGYFSFDNENEAHFVCAIMNSKIASELLENRSNKSKWGISINMVKKIPIPKFNKNNKQYLELVKLSKQAHKETNNTIITNIEKKINILAKKILVE